MASIPAVGLVTGSPASFLGGVQPHGLKVLALYAASGVLGFRRRRWRDGDEGEEEAPVATSEQLVSDGAPELGVTPVVLCILAISL